MVYAIQMGHEPEILLVSVAACESISNSITLRVTDSTKIDTTLIASDTVATTRDTTNTTTSVTIATTSAHLRTTSK